MLADLVAVHECVHKLVRVRELVAFHKLFVEQCDESECQKSKQPGRAKVVSIRIR